MASIAIIKTGGKQYKVEKGTRLSVEKLSKKEGSEVIFKEVLLLGDEKSVEVGTPTISNARVVGKVLEEGRAKKVIVFKYKRRKRYSRKYGHRQPFTKVEITDIKKGAARTKAPATASGGASLKAVVKKKAAVKK